MKTRLEIVAAACVSVAAILMLTGCTLSASHEANANTEEAYNPLEIKVEEALRRQIKVGEIKSAEVAGTLHVAGRIEADATRMARIGSPVAGRITNLLAMEGETVERGQVLASLHSTELSDAQFSFIKVTSQEQVLERAAERAEQLVKADVIGTAEVQRRQAEVLQARAEIAALRQQLQVLGMSDQAIEELRNSRKLNSEYRIVSSIDGTILERKVTAGQIVQPAEIAFMVADLSNVWLVADIPEISAGHVRVGQEVKAEIPALPDEKIAGRLSFVSATVDPETRTVRVRMNLSNPQRKYKPAMLATMQVKDGLQRQNVLPVTAVVREDNHEYVFVQKAAGTFVLRQVALGEQYGDAYVLKDGLQPGENVVLDGAFHLNNERKRRAIQGGA